MVEAKALRRVVRRRAQRLLWELGLESSRRVIGGRGLPLKMWLAKLVQVHSLGAYSR